MLRLSFGLKIANEKISVAGTRTRVSRVRAEYPNQLDYNGSMGNGHSIILKFQVGDACGPIETNYTDKFLASMGILLCFLTFHSLVIIYIARNSLLLFFNSVNFFLSSLLSFIVKFV